jgi:hypothetical protein
LADQCHETFLIVFFDSRNYFHVNSLGGMKLGGYEAATCAARSLGRERLHRLTRL